MRWNTHSIVSGGKKVAVSIILAWMVGFCYTFVYHVATSKVIGGSCFVYYIPDETAGKVRKVLLESS